MKKIINAPHVPTGFTAQEVHAAAIYPSRVDMRARLRNIVRAMRRWAHTDTPYQAGMDTAHLLAQAADVIDQQAQEIASLRAWQVGVRQDASPEAQRIRELAAEYPGNVLRAEAPDAP
jgi:acyl-CoA reductase-like NAD-dependent aldehyde dehydrogenase